MFNNVLVTGGAGFIGANFIQYLLAQESFKGRVINLDKLTYAANLDNLLSVSNKEEGKRYFFENVDICNQSAINNVFEKYEIDCVIHFAAESHVDRSIEGPAAFINTNIIGTFNLLEAARNCWGDSKEKRFHHVSTDEVYGSLGPEGFFYEETSYDPRSPYSASKASSDHLVRAYYHTYGLPVTLSNCSNNYGPFQFPEKLIPLMICNMKEGKSLPVYGDGKNIRDWLFVQDHVAAIWLIVSQSRIGESYNVGGDTEIENIELVKMLCEKVAFVEGKKHDEYLPLIKYVDDRLGHDRRYAMSFDKIRNELGWRPLTKFADGLEKTIRWYLSRSHDE